MGEKGKGNPPRVNPKKFTVKSGQCFEELGAYLACIAVSSGVWECRTGFETTNAGTWVLGHIYQGLSGMECPYVTDSQSYLESYMMNRLASTDLHVEPTSPSHLAPAGHVCSHLAEKRTRGVPLHDEP